MRRLIVALLVLVVLAVAGCGSSSHSSASASSSTKTHLAKTKFVLHAGVAFGVFHRWIYKPFKQNELQHPLAHKLALVKALAAGAFVVHEVKLARADAAHSKVLSHVVVPLIKVGATVALIRAALARGHVNSGAINSANSSIADVHAASAAAGQPITETTAGAHI